MKGSGEPNAPVPPPRGFLGAGKAVSDSVCPKGLPAGLLPPNILDPFLFSEPREPNPLLFTKPAKPEDDDGVPEAPEALPNALLPAPEPRPANPDWPNAGAVVDVAVVAQGEDLTPMVEARPNPEGFPNVGPEDAGELPKELEPKVGPPVVGAVVGVVGVPHGDAFDPRAEEPPKAGAAEGEPNADPVAGAGLAKAGAGAAACTGACAEESTAIIPEYVVPFLIEGVYMTHQAQRTPSCVSSQYAGTGPGDSSISSVGIGLYTVSFADISSAHPTGTTFWKSSVMGSVALLESSAISVVVNLLVMDSAGASVANGLDERLRRPTSGDAVEATISRSCRLGWKSFSLTMR